ncbi:DUF4974 domain-containing protein [Pedobacter sp. KBS0701]|uniref:FecR domain-containing protein n=1 Tax=Pedobacter sp. KBS0701 TaxID=2578106 RepID=UPI00110E91A8|nr:FecR domain-containing protein [Pedobacter sp. KBS0701]QDW27904.1 DUF4974 domain-containing protein [Pedobacter sp. KBS0701]
MQDVRLNILFKKYFDKTANQQEREELFSLVRIAANKENIEKEMELHWLNFNAKDNPFSVQDKSAMVEKILHFIDEEIIMPDKKIKTYKLFTKWVAAASIAIVVMAGSYFYFNNHKQLPEKVAYQNDVAPGGNGATLTLTNGQKILVNDVLSGNIAMQSGVKISKTPDGQIVYEITDNGSKSSGYNTLSTSRGEQTQVRLPDGTIVFLNAESSLKYPVSFVEKGKRQVFLTGEGYFEVAKDRSHPFIVKTTRQEVQVLGTHFNINSYDDEAATTTTLLEGSVLVSNSNLVQKVLRPGEQSVLSSGRIQVAPADVEEAIDWKNGEFIFGGDNFRTVMRKIERWYNIEVIYEPSAPINLQLGGFSSRSRNISTVLKMIAKTGEVHFRIEGRKVFVSK